MKIDEKEPNNSALRSHSFEVDYTEKSGDHQLQCKKPVNGRKLPTLAQKDFIH